MATNHGWAAAEMAGARLDDARRRTNLIRMGERLAEQPGKSLSAVLGPALRQAAHRLCADGDHPPADLIAGHVEQTVRRAVAAGERVVVAQDPCRLDYFTHRATTGLGPVGNERDSRGLFAHPALALRRDGQPLGLLPLSLWARDQQDDGRRERRRKLAGSEKETNKWLVGLRAVEAALPAQVPVVLVQDREADADEFFAMERRKNTHLIGRGSLPRRAALLPEGEVPPEEQGWPKVPLNRAWEQASVRAQATVRVGAQGKRKAREAQVEVRSARARIWLTEAELEVLTVKFGTAPQTMREAIRAVARLGGWEGPPSAGEPGVKSLWQGLRDLERLAEGWQMAKNYWGQQAQRDDPS